MTNDLSHLHLQTERLLLRPFTVDDHPALYRMYLSPAVNRFIGGPPPPFEQFSAYQRNYLETAYATHGIGRLAVFRRDDGAFVGRCGLMVFDVDGVDEVELGYAFAEEAWGRGYATEAARAVRDLGFRHLAVDRLISLIHHDNTRSLRVAARNGMTYWKDADHRGDRLGVYRITRAEWEELGRE